jgi:hypothetical protein
MSEDREGAGESHDDLTDLRLVSIRNVPDEATATLLCDFLKSQGIEARTVPVQMPWFSTLQSLHHGFWGRVEVLEKDEKRARTLVEEYLAATPEPGEET